MSAHLSLQSLSKQFGVVKVLKDISLEIPEGSLTVLLGPSGCGKSTLLRCIAGLEHPDQGDILIDGESMREVPPQKRNIGMVFQAYALYPHMTVAENLGFGLKLKGVDKKTIQKRVDEAAEILRLQDYLERRPAHLSGGQQQRVAIGRCIVRKPKVWLFDEPLSNLDAALRTELRLELLSLHQELKATMIYVTHDQVEAMTLATQMVLLERGSIRQVGLPQEMYHRPVHRFVGEFLGTPPMNFLSRPLAPALAQELRFHNPSQHNILGVRGEQVKLSAEGLPGACAAVERLGADSLVHIKLLSGESWVIRQDAAKSIPDIGELVHLAFPPDAALFFDPRSGEAITS